MSSFAWVGFLLLTPHSIMNTIRSELILNYWVIVKRYPFPTGVVGGSIPAVKASLDLTENKLVS